MEGSEAERNVVYYPKIARGMVGTLRARLPWESKDDKIGEESEIVL